mmetsp:Transcript_29259/g.41878  ORF Transcript_29259/g.41878 Transcript_29259/m.41878 type:complete len:1101 (-) Transcript_29259:352-3654(-)
MAPSTSAEGTTKRENEKNRGRPTSATNSTTKSGVNLQPGKVRTPLNNNSKPAQQAEAKQVKLDPKAAVWKPVPQSVVPEDKTTTNNNNNVSKSSNSPAVVPSVSAWSKPPSLETIKAAASKPVVPAAKPAVQNNKVVVVEGSNKTSSSSAAAKGQLGKGSTQPLGKTSNNNNSQQQQQNHKKNVPGKQDSPKPQGTSHPQQQPLALAKPVSGTKSWAGAVAKQQSPVGIVKKTSQEQLKHHPPPNKHHHHHPTKEHHHHHGSTSNKKKLDAKDANLLEPDEKDGQHDDAVVKRFAHATLLSYRILFLNVPEDWSIEEEEEAAPKRRRYFAWTSPTRVEDIRMQHKHPRSNKAYVYGDHPHTNNDNTNEHPSSKDDNHHHNNNNDKGSHQEQQNIFVNEFGEAIYVKPLEVNDKTRWRAKSTAGGNTSTNKEDAEDEHAAALQRALLILNKLTPTNFPKLSEQFITDVIASEPLLTDGIKLLIAKAQQEPHFCPMYAQVCLCLASKPLAFEDGTNTTTTNEALDHNKKQKLGKTFKRHLLEECQTEFEISSTRENILGGDNNNNSTEDTTPDLEYRTRLAKKKYLGHMTFIGEIYKVGLCNTKVMLMCLPILLTEGKMENSPSPSSTSSEEVDEEKIECFVKLMSTIGDKLQNDCTTLAQSKGKPESLQQWDAAWDRVASLAKDSDKTLVSNRIKFMLQDLIELRDNGWVARRKLETAKTLQEIHSEAEKELPRSRISSSSSLRSLAATPSSKIVRGVSAGDVSKLDTATMDKDGFVTVAKFRRATSGGNLGGGGGTSKPPGNYRRSVSDAASYSPGTSRKTKAYGKDADNESSYPEFQASLTFESVEEHRESTDAGNIFATEEIISIPELSNETPPLTALLLLAPSECGQKVKGILKDYFVNHDVSDALISYEELVQPLQLHALDRGVKCVETSLQFMMEQSKARLETFLLLWEMLTKGSADGDAKSRNAIFDQKMIIGGIRKPLEALSDTIIDAPLANIILTNIVASMISWGALPPDFSFLLNVTDSSFQADVYATFAIDLIVTLEQLSNDHTSGLLGKQVNVDIIGKLMASEEREKWENVTEFINFVAERNRKKAEKN